MYVCCSRNRNKHSWSWRLKVDGVCKYELISGSRNSLLFHVSSRWLFTSLSSSLSLRAVERRQEKWSECCSPSFTFRTIPESLHCTSSCRINMKTKVNVCSNLYCFNLHYFAAVFIYRIYIYISLFRHKRQPQSVTQENIVLLSSFLGLATTIFLNHVSYLLCGHIICFGFALLSVCLSVCPSVLYGLLTRIQIGVNKQKVAQGLK